MAEQERCNLCDLALGWGGTRVVRVGKFFYHALCWVTCVAPSVKAPITPVAVN